MTVDTMNLSQVTSALTSGEYPTQWAYNLNQLTMKGLTVDEFASEVERVTDGYVKTVRSYNGNISGYVVRGNPQIVTPGFADSNASTIVRGSISAPVETTVVSSGSTAIKTSRLAGVGTKVATAAGKLALPVTLASVGVTLGKVIDETLYNANPQFWDSVGLETVNPQTWSSIAGGDGTLGGSFINAIFGIDPNTGETQAYMDADAFAYMAYCLQLRGMFDVGVDEITDPVVDGTTLNTPIYKLPFNCTQEVTATSSSSAASGTWYIDPNVIVSVWSSTKPSFIAARTQGTTGYVAKYFDGSSYNSVMATDSNVKLAGVYQNNSNYRVQFGGSNPMGVFTRNNKTAYYIGDYPSDVGYEMCTVAASANQSTNRRNYVAYAILFNTYSHGESIPGISDQTGATIPDFSNLSESDYLPYLQQTYPDMFNDAIPYNVVQPDGTIAQKTYIPITLPDTSNVVDTQPSSGEQSQTNPSINPSTSPNTLIDLLTKLLQQPTDDTEPATDTPIPPENPTDTGDGSSPTPIVPVGSASALWKIYHPTQAQVDSFGGWLWSSNFIDQILKIFNNPMEAVIGLHKVYATPVDAGTTTIKVGYLDSGVSSAYIEQQYITINCGSVDLYEQFGNVFDYSPFTDVQIYLPFIGIMPLNVGDIMRSTISVEYGVDVITGACLAQVKVSRDGNNSVLYQYSGNCAVQYPISSGSYMGIVSSIISVAGGVAATVASGGAAAPLALGAAGGLLNAHTTIQRSGSFSGNSGAMGGKIPYLIITRPQTKVADNAEQFIGYPSNNYTTVGQCNGYIKAISAHIINIEATEDELNEIYSLLLSGIII